VGSYWLNDCVPVLQKKLGSKFKLYDGYSTRSRSSGGFDRICGIVMHHDADSTSGSDDSVLDYEYKNSDDRPIGNFHVQRDGDIWIGAAGASNHAGKGGPVTTSGGTVPQDAGNKFLIGIEASNNGVGEPWSNTIMDSYLQLVTELCIFYHLNPMTDIYAHWTWCQPSCPGRKIDPAGPTPKYPKFGGSSGANKWNMDEVRKEVNARISTTPSPEPEPTPPPTGGDWMADLPTIKKGDTGPYVKRMQHLLAAAGFMNEANAANYDGVWGNGTESAKVGFDKAKGLTPSPPSDCGDKSWESLITGKTW
jgi:N-acetylmuramoyl-L-alanine amidase